MIPLPPSDSLYKFIAISGVVLIVLGGWLYNGTMRETSDWTIDISNRIARIESATARIDEERAGLSEPLDTVGVSEARKMATLALRERHLSEQIGRIEAVLSLPRPTTKEVDVMNRRFEYGIRFAALAAVQGMLLAIAGFVMWYFKVQRHLDTLLELQVKSATKSE